MIYHYTVYGLNIALSQALTQLRPAEHNDTDVFIDISNLSIPDLSEDKQGPEGANTSDGISVFQTRDWICISYPRSQEDVLRFYISKDGSKVISDKPNTIPISDVESFILGPILGCVLRLRQRICIHASVMEFGGKAFAFVGNKGAGKSTTAAALLQAGARLISDDVAVLNAGSPVDATVYPGYPSVRLFPKILSIFGLDKSNYKQVVSSMDKCYVPLIDTNKALDDADNWQFNSQPCQLTTIYTLNARQPDLHRTKIQTLSTQQALISLAPHGYARRILNKNQRAEEFSFMAKLSQRINVKSIDRPDTLERLPQVAEDILADVSNTSVEILNRDIKQRHRIET